MRDGGDWVVLDTGKGGFKEKRLGTTDLDYWQSSVWVSKQFLISHVTFLKVPNFFDVFACWQ